MRKWLENDGILVWDGWNQSGAIGLSRIALESLFAYFHIGETVVFLLMLVVVYKFGLL